VPSKCFISARHCAEKERNGLKGPDDSPTVRKGKKQFGRLSSISEKGIFHDFHFSKWLQARTELATI